MLKQRLTLLMTAASLLLLASWPAASQQFPARPIRIVTAGFGGGLISGWNDMHYPSGHPLAGQSMDLSFVLTVPEPSSIVMAGFGLVALVGMVARRRGNVGR